MGLSVGGLFFASLPGGWGRRGGASTEAGWEVSVGGRRLAVSTV